MKYGIFILPRLLLKIKVDINATAIIHNARANFTVVATSYALDPYLLAAPTTELVSCMAIAHYKPNCVCDKLSEWPIIGNTNNTIEFKINMEPNATEICFSSALITGDMAAIALPPQVSAMLKVLYLAVDDILKSLTPKKSV